MASISEPKQPRVVLRGPYRNASLPGSQPASMATAHKGLDSCAFVSRCSGLFPLNHSNVHPAITLVYPLCPFKGRYCSS